MSIEIPTRAVTILFVSQPTLSDELASRIQRCVQKATRIVPQIDNHTLSTLRQQVRHVLANLARRLIGKLAYIHLTVRRVWNHPCIDRLQLDPSPNHLDIDRIHVTDMQDRENHRHTFFAPYHQHRLANRPSRSINAVNRQYPITWLYPGLHRRRILHRSLNDHTLTIWCLRNSSSDPEKLSRKIIPTHTHLIRRDVRHMWIAQRLDETPNRLLRHLGRIDKAIVDVFVVNELERLPDNRNILRHRIRQLPRLGQIDHPRHRLHVGIRNRRHLILVRILDLLCGDLNLRFLRNRLRINDLGGLNSFRLLSSRNLYVDIFTDNLSRRFAFRTARQSQQQHQRQRRHCEERKAVDNGLSFHLD